MSLWWDFRRRLGAWIFGPQAPEPPVEPRAWHCLLVTRCGATRAIEWRGERPPRRMQSALSQRVRAFDGPSVYARMGERAPIKFETRDFELDDRSGGGLRFNPLIYREMEPEPTP